MRIILSLFTITFWFYAHAETKFPEDKLQQVQDIMDESRPLEVIHEIEKTPESEKPSAGRVKYLRDILTRATKEDFSDAKKLLDQLNFIPYKKDPDTGVQIFKVTNVKKSSLFDRAGLKVGDLIVNGSSTDKAVSTIKD